MKDKYNQLAQRLGVNVIYNKETRSTNIDARSKSLAHGDVVVAGNQTQGRGQRGNHWESQKESNLTFSIIVEPTFLPAASQFLLSEAVSLAISDTLDEYAIKSQVKWPNDIYVGNAKIAGILIENDIMGANLARSIVGVGLNVNQSVFGDDVPNPISMKLCANREFDLAEVFECLYNNFRQRYSALESGMTKQIEVDYHNKLYLLGTPHTFSLPNGDRFKATIRKVEPSGELILDHGEGKLHSYLFKEVSF